MLSQHLPTHDQSLLNEVLGSPSAEQIREHEEEQLALLRHDMIEHEKKGDRYLNSKPKKYLDALREFKEALTIQVAVQAYPYFIAELNRKIAACYLSLLKPEPTNALKCLEEAFGRCNADVSDLNFDEDAKNQMVITKVNVYFDLAVFYINQKIFNKAADYASAGLTFNDTLSSDKDYLKRKLEGENILTKCQQHESKTTAAISALEIPLPVPSTRAASDKENNLPPILSVLKSLSDPKSNTLGTMTPRHSSLVENSIFYPDTPPEFTLEASALSPNDKTLSSPKTEGGSPALRK